MIVDELPYSCIVGINLPYSCIVGINLPYSCIVGINLPYSCVVGINLPYSCIVGINLLNTLKNWGGNNNYSTLYLNSSAVNLFSEPEYNNQVNLITREKLILLPGEIKIIKTLAVGQASQPLKLIDRLRHQHSLRREIPSMRVERVCVFIRV